MKIALFKNGPRGDAVLDVLRGHDVRIFGPEYDVNSEAFVSRLDVDLSIIAGYSQIFREPLFSKPKHGTINLHAGPLPMYRGGSPLNWQIINGEREIGLSIIQVDRGIDTGPILCERSFPIDHTWDIQAVHDKANEMFPEMVRAVLSRPLNPRPQVNEAQDLWAPVRYWHQRSYKDGLIDFTKSAEDVHNLIRAITRPYGGAFTYRGRDKLTIWKSDLTRQNYCGTPGRVYWFEAGPIIICGHGAIILKDWEIEGRLEHGQHLHPYIQEAA